MIELPVQVLTPRLHLRAPTEDDAEALNAAILESFDALHAWMPWAASRPSVADTRAFCADARDQREAGSGCPLLMIDREGDVLVGATGYAAVDPEVPSFEIGYWCRTTRSGHGYVTEATRALTRHAFDVLGARRVELRMDDRNHRSAAVAERLGFDLEGVLRNQTRDHLGHLRSTRVYALVSVDGLAMTPRPEGG